jgi:NADPH-dependent 2,4-dienoyl-CoA reductase/sulfur reductase-like enzyme/peroxiredoxin family protein/rhodanese-related sulfurtransferase/TusA-related sulfurtransferase
MSQRKRVVIVGGVAGGASAAARLRRLSEDLDILMFERGEYISFANCGLPYHIGETIPKRESLLVQSAAGMRQRYRIAVRTLTEVLRIDRENKRVVVRDLKTGSESTESYDSLILSPGAAPVRPPIDGAYGDRVFTLRNIADMDAIKAVIDEQQPAGAIVIGGGYIGLEMAEALRQRGVGVTLVEMAPQVFVAADPEMVEPIHQHLKLHGVDLRLGQSVTAIVENGEAVEATLSSGERISTQLVIMAVGVRPETTLAKEAGLDIGQTGGIAVDDHLRTSDPDIYAIGDATEVSQFVDGRKSLIPLAGPANRQGRIAADNICGRNSTYKNTQGTAICKVFDLAIGMTGLSENALKQSGASYEKIYVHPASHAGYYPGAEQITLKLLFSMDDGKILGAQAVGAAGLDKRIDVIAVALRAGLSVEQLQELELSYAPPYGSAKDPVNYAGFVATNVLNGDSAICHTEDLLAPREDQRLLDVRTQPEVLAGTIPGSLNIPLDEIRERTGEIPRDKELLVFCAAGLRGYLACRILEQRGYRCKNLSGGYKTYKAATAQLKAEEGKPQEVTDDTGSESEQPAATESPPTTANHAPATVVKEIDARALQCPGPIMELNTALREIEVGQAVSITASDPGFGQDIEGWCRSTGNRLLELTAEGGGIRATIAKENGALLPTSDTRCATGAGDLAKNKSMVVFSGDFDKAIAAFIIANGAAAMGSQVTLFFTFWGLNILRRDESVRVKKTPLEKMFGWMMPRGPNKLKLSKMNMGGMGLGMIKGIMRKKNVTPLPDLIASAQKAGVRLVACTMTMELMGIKQEELIDGIELGGVAMYLDKAESGNVNLFI